LAQTASRSIRHNDAMRDEEIIAEVEAFEFDAGPLTAERRNRGFTLVHAATGTPIARLNPVKGHDGLFDLAPEERLPRSMMYDHGNGSKLDEEIADGLHA
jgi:hypothetical protein